MQRLSLAILLAAGPILAGCLGVDDSVGKAADAVGNTSDLPLVLPDNRSGDFNAFRETNLTDDYGHHNHDYWQGRARVTIFAGHLELFGSPTGEQSAVFRPPSGPEHLVFEGTGAIEVVIKNPQRHACEPVFNWNGALICTDHTQTGTAATGEIKGPGIPDPAPSSGLRLEFIHAASAADEWLDGGALSWNAPTVLKIKDPKWTDMPHSSGSLWAFRVISPNPQDSTLTFDIETTALRAAGVIPPWPGHPVFYTPDKHYRLLYDGPGKTTSNPPFEGTTVEVAEPARLISAGTRTLIISANVTSLTGQVPGVEPSHIYLYYHNASYSNWNFTSPFDANATADKGTYRWVIRVDPNGMDSPYAPSSRWEFMLRAASSTPAVSCYDGCYGYTLEYTLTIVATDLFPACTKEEGGKCVAYAYTPSFRA